MTHARHFKFEESLEKLKLNEPGRQKFEKRESWQLSKRAKL